MHVFEAATANEVWLKAAARFHAGQGVRTQRSRAGDTNELLGVVFVIDNPRQRWVVSRQPAINPAFAIAEVVWIMSGRNDSAFINYWNPKLPKYAGNAANYHGAYGHRLRRHFGLDQLKRAYEALSRNPDSRQVVLQIWDPVSDLPEEDGSPADSDIPCNICSFAKIRDGKLEWTQILRSNDLFLGVPHNFVQFTSLQEVLAGWLGVEMGQYRHLSDCLHVYQRDLDQVSQSLADVSDNNSDTLSFTQEESQKLFSQFSSKMDQMRGAALSQKSLRKLCVAKTFPQALQNWLLVVAADCARRRKWINLSFDIMLGCTNPALRQLWENWFSRWWSARQEEVVSHEAAIYAQPFLPFQLA